MVSTQENISADFVFCINALEVMKGRVWNGDETYAQSVALILEKYVGMGIPKPKVAINLHPKNIEDNST